MKRIGMLCGVTFVAAIGACVTAPEPRPVAEDAATDTSTPEASKRPSVAAPTGAGRKPPEPRISEVDALLIEFERLRKLPAGDLAREQEIARQVFTQSKTDVTRVKWAMTLSLPGSTPTDEARALELLEPLLRNLASPLRGLVFLLTASIQEQRRLSTLAQGLQQNMQTLQQSNQTLQQNLLGFQQKLDALRTLERSLTERGEAVAPRKK